MKQTAVEWLEERLTLSLGDELKPLRGFFVIYKCIIYSSKQGVDESKKRQ